MKSTSHKPPFSHPVPAPSVIFKSQLSSSQDWVLSHCSKAEQLRAQVKAQNGNQMNKKVLISEYTYLAWHAPT